MSDRQIFVLAATVWFAGWCGAKLAVSDLWGRSTTGGSGHTMSTSPLDNSIAGINIFWIFLALAVAVSIWAWVTQRPLVLILVLAIFTLVHGYKDGSGSEISERSYSGWATIKTDPVPTAGGVATVLAIDGNNYRVRSWGSSAGWLRHKLAGESVHIDAKLKALQDPPLWLRANGIDGRATLKSVSGYRYGSQASKLSNWIRRKVEYGARTMSRSQRSLYTGLVYGDIRFQSDLAADEFDAAGLSHLVAVSGQNIVFVLAIAAPVLRRCNSNVRLLLVLVILFVFATMTRFEPSVVRASAMSSVAALSVFAGLELNPKRLLGVAATIVIIVEPLIVQKVGFQLSVAASMGIMFWAKRFAHVLPGPRILSETLAVTGAAQLAVSPLLLWYFGSIPVASLPANLLAGPAAGPVMMWGLTAGLVTAWLPNQLVQIVNWLPILGIKWIQFVAGAAAAVPLGNLGASHIFLLTVLGCAAVQSRRTALRNTVQSRRAALRNTVQSRRTALRNTVQSRRTALRNVALCLIVVVLVQPSFWLYKQGPVSQVIGRSSSLIVEGDKTLLWIGANFDSQKVLAAVRESTVSEIDLVVVEKANFAVANLLKDLESRVVLVEVLSAQGNLGVGETVIGEQDSVLASLDTSSFEITASRGRISISKSRGVTFEKNAEHSVGNTG